MRLVVTGGGTGGHVFPIVATLEDLRSRPIDLEVTWIGSSAGFERETAAELGIPFHPVTVGKLRRYLALQTLPDTMRVPVGVFQSLALVRRLKPDVIFSTGGYAGVPAIIAGWMLRVPSITHEQTASLGLATKINARFCDRVALSHDKTPRPKTRASANVVITGNPVRSALLAGKREEAVQRFGLAGDRPLLYITGGAQGAKGINDAVAGCLEELLEAVEVIHQTGPNELNGNFRILSKQRRGLPPAKQARYHLIERVGPELAHIYAAADLVLSRSGAGTVSELAATGLPSILVPLPGADEQAANAEVLSGVGAAVIIDQTELTPTRLLSEVQILSHDADRLASMAAQARGTSRGSAAARLADEILDLAGLPVDPSTAP